MLLQEKIKRSKIKWEFIIKLAISKVVDSNAGKYWKSNFNK
jgi:hypothetical protein